MTRDKAESSLKLWTPTTHTDTRCYLAIGEPVCSSCSGRDAAVAPAGTMGDGGGGGLDVVVFPWLAFGHMIPYLELSKRLAARGHDVTFVSTPRNVSRLPPVPAGLSARLRFVSLPMPPVDGLPEGAESTADVPPGNDELIKKACDGLAAPFAAFMADLVAAGGRKPDWIIIDFAYHWLPPIAAEHNVRTRARTFQYFCLEYLIEHLARARMAVHAGAVRRVPDRAGRGDRVSGAEVGERRAPARAAGLHRAAEVVPSTFRHGVPPQRGEVGRRRLPAQRLRRVRH
jgi:hypothetical protein